MVAVHENSFVDGNPTTLCDWVRNFRIKRMQMKRKLRGDLRVSAMLTTALVSAEAELRRKQQDRFERWLKFQAKLDSGYSNRKFVTTTSLSMVEEKQRVKTIEDLWKSELSDLDKFMRAISTSTSLSSSNNCNNNNNNNKSSKKTCAEEAAAETRTNIDFEPESSEKRRIHMHALRRSISMTS